LRIIHHCGSLSTFVDFQFQQGHIFVIVASNLRLWTSCKGEMEHVKQCLFLVKHLFLIHVLLFSLFTHFFLDCSRKMYFPFLHTNFPKFFLAKLSYFYCSVQTFLLCANRLSNLTLLLYKRRIWKEETHFANSNTNICALYMAGMNLVSALI
jgi:hypothetical protein